MRTQARRAIPVQTVQTYAWSATILRWLMIEGCRGTYVYLNDPRRIASEPDYRSQDP